MSKKSANQKALHLAESITDSKPAKGDDSLGSKKLKRKLQKAKKLIAKKRS
jgi:hypothetical protein